MRKIIYLMIIGIVLTSLSTGCMTILKGTTQQVEIRSTPTGADFIITDGYNSQIFRAITPSTVTLSKERGEIYFINIEKEGYEELTEQIEYTSNFRDILFLNSLFLGGPIGYFIDSKYSAKTYQDQMNYILIAHGSLITQITTTFEINRDILPGKNIRQKDKAEQIYLRERSVPYLMNMAAQRYPDFNIINIKDIKWKLVNTISGRGWGTNVYELSGNIIYTD